MQRRHFLSAMAGFSAAALAPAALARARALRIGVVGGGIVGSAIAWQLARGGARVFQFEKAEPASGATRNSFAWLNAFVDDAHYRALRLRSLAAYHEIDQRLQLGIRWHGYAQWARTPEELRALQAAAAQLDGTAHPARTLDAAQLSQLIAGVAPGPLAGAFYSSIDGHLDPVAVTRRFIAAARRHGAQLLTGCEVQALEFTGDHLAQVVTQKGRVALDRLVVAAGVDTPRILAMAGFSLKLRHAPGILAHSVPLPPITAVVCEAPGGLSFKQMADGSVVGTDAPEPPDLPVHREILARATDFPDAALRAMHGDRILGKIGQFIPGVRALALERLTLGFRPLPLDDRPIVGPLPDSPDVYVAVTHSGVTLAPILARYVSSELLEEAREPSLSPYRPQRFGGMAAS
jgi:glycine/D-amino acid oxidase-like deaminating enzyme